MVGFPQSCAGAVVVAVVVVSVAAAQADVLFVDGNNCPGPGDGSEVDPYCSIQTAIDNAVNTDEVVVAPGIYFETINFFGKAITLRSSGGAAVTIISANGPQGADSAVTCASGEGDDTIIEGFTLTDGTGTEFEWFPTFFVDVGGGVYCNASNPTVTNCTFSGNSANDRGGGMYNVGSSPTVTDCTFSGNSAVVAGGMYNFGSSPTVLNCMFSGNSAVSAGGMYNGGGTPVVTNCTFSGNSASIAGGGMFNGASNPTVTNCTFESNTAILGGGMYSQTSSSPTVTNCTFSGNMALNSGGMYNVGGTPAVTNCTFSGNGVGGMFNFSSNPTVTNCVVWDNGPNEIANVFGAVTTVSYSNVQGGFPGIGNIDADPLFVDPDNGDFRLQAGSPCIDAADNTAVPTGVLRDLDGNPRFIDSTLLGTMATVDMGAYEFQRPVGGGRAVGDGPWLRDVLTLLGWNAPLDLD